MESLRVEKKDIYTIEVNDNGDTIEFDLLDIELPFKLHRAYEKVNKAGDELKSKLLIIDKKEDVKGKGIITKKEMETLNAYRETYKKMREGMDEFLGEGACQKIFGDRNYLEMYNDLFEALEPHLKKMKISTDGIAERIKNKYSSKDESVLK